MSVSRHLRSRLLAGISVCLVAALAVAADAVRAQEPAERSATSAAAMPAGRMLVLEVQRHLSSLGYDPGPVDGVPGEQTRQAIRTFERDRQRSVRGEATPEILQLLRRETMPEPAAARAEQAAEATAEQPQQAPPAASEELEPSTVKPVPIAEATRESTLAGTIWEFQDENGSAFSITFEPDGRVSGPGFSRGWTWRQDGQDVELTYDNRVGGLSTRAGQLLSGREMAGMARSSRGREWTWRASRTR